MGVERVDDVALESGRFVGVIQGLGDGRGGVEAVEAGFDLGVVGRGDCV